MDRTGLTYTIQIDITPKPAARPRFSSKGRVYNDPSYKAWLKEFADLVREQWDNDVLQRILAVLDSLNLSFLKVEDENPWIKIKIYL